MRPGDGFLCIMNAAVAAVVVFCFIVFVVQRIRINRVQTVMRRQVLPVNPAVVAIQAVAVVLQPQQ